MHKSFLSFWYLRFCQDSRVISARMFHLGTFRHVHLLVLWMFRQIDVTTRERFNIGTFWHDIFWHMNILTHGYFGTLQRNIDIFGTCATVYLTSFRNVPVPKIPRAESSSCQKVPKSKLSRVEMSICWNVCRSKQCAW